MPHGERHRSERIGWLRAAVLGANDGIVSTASLVVGVAAAASARQDVLIAGVAGLVAGALSMAAGEYVSVSSQADTEQADLKRERHELATEPQAEEDELTSIYVRRGLEPELARIVARQLMAKGALGGTRTRRARPDRGTRGPSPASCPRVGGHLRRRSGGTDTRDTGGPDQRAASDRCRGVTGVPRRPRRNGRVRRRRTNSRRRRESDGLGSCGNARDGSRRKALRNGCWMNGRSEYSR